MKYGLIGEHLSHSFSVIIHSKMGEYPYKLKELAADELGRFMHEKSFLGINVTIPYKKTVMRYLDKISEDAEKIGAVNTVINKNGELCGYNTDFFGLSEMLAYNGVDLCGKTVLILGTGGTSKTALAVCTHKGAGEIIRLSRTAQDGAVSYEDAYLHHTDAEVIINTTPVGMYPNTDAVPIDLSKFARLEAVCDCIYNPVNTQLVLEARKRGVKAFTGLYMLVAQGALASSLFTGKELEEDKLEKVYLEILSQKSNIALIGMPSCGKTTVGAMLSKKLGLNFVDSDVEIVKKIGMSISEYFEKYGEEAFRDVESEVINELALTDGTVISTGGGCIKRYGNIKALKRCGQIVYIDRPLDMLVLGQGRPLSKSKEALEKLYSERKDLYEAYADIKVDGGKTPEAVRDEIISKLIKKG